MKQHLLNLRSLFFFALMAFAVNVSAEEITYSFLSSLPSGWTSTATPNAYETTDRGCQFTASSTLKLQDVKNVTKVVITCSSNIGDTNSIGVTVGGKALGSTVTLAKANNVEKTFSSTTALSGDLAIKITRKDKSVYIKKVVITADASGDSGTGGGTDDGPKLDPNNTTYQEPTIVKPTGVTAYGEAYTFVQNNVLVSATTGTQVEDYFGCNAGASITFTATKEIKGILVNGYLKKDFSATASDGDLYYYDASEDAVEGDTILVIMDIDSKSVTLSCDKQIRFYSVYLYFEENPDVEVDDDGGDGEYNFDYEPAEVKSLDITFSEIDATDYSEYFGYPCVDIIMDNDDFEMDLLVYAPYTEGTILAPGTYPISDSEEEGTVLASPGGDESYDYPTFICTDFNVTSEGVTYSTAYYLVSGNLTVTQEGGKYKFQIDAKTAKGSTVKAVYEGELDADGIMTIRKESSAKEGKMLRNGHVIIAKESKVYNAAGKRVE